MILQYLEKRGITNIKRENFSFSTKLIIGDFLRPSGETDASGEEKYVRLSEELMKDEIDKVRKENGWKPRKRIGPLSSKDGGTRTAFEVFSFSVKNSFTENPEEPLGLATAGLWTDRAIFLDLRKRQLAFSLSEI